MFPAYMTNFRTKVFGNYFDVAQNHVIFILFNGTMRLKAMINECKIESKTRPNINQLNVNLDMM